MAQVNANQPQILYGKHKGFSVLTDKEVEQIIAPEVINNSGVDAIFIAIDKKQKDYFAVTNFFKQKFTDKNTQESEYYSGLVKQNVFKDEVRTLVQDNLYIYVPKKFVETEKEIKGFNLKVETASKIMAEKEECFKEINSICSDYFDKVKGSDVQSYQVWNGKNIDRDYAYGEVVAKNKHYVALKSGVSNGKLYMRVISKDNVFNHDGIFPDVILEEGNSIKMDWVRKDNLVFVAIKEVPSKVKQNEISTIEKTEAFNQNFEEVKVAEQLIDKEEKKKAAKKDKVAQQEATNKVVAAMISEMDEEDRALEEAQRKLNKNTAKHYKDINEASRVKK